MKKITSLSYFLKLKVYSGKMIEGPEKNQILKINKSFYRAFKQFSVDF
jgi:hypothetical protein